MANGENAHVSNERKMIIRYIREVNKEIIATNNQKQKLFGDLISDIHERIADGKIASYEDIVAHFGPPARVAKDFFASADIKEIKKKLLFKQILFFAVACCLLIFIAYRLFMMNGAFDSIHNLLGLHTEGFLLLSLLQ